jgi:beta-glucosidase
MIDLKNYILFAGLALVQPFAAFAQQRPVYRDTTKPVALRVADLLKRMTPEEKIAQLQSQLTNKPTDQRNYQIGNVRESARLLNRPSFQSPGTCAAYLNADTKKTIEASRFGIPVMQHEEALHGAQWGVATVFPQSIGMAASFDDSLYYKEGQVVAQETRAVGIRQVLTPVINIARDARWGRMQETFGEDVCLTSRMGVAYTKALEQGGLIATLKHFADNYGAGGHDSYASDNSWRVEYETFMEPFRACIEEGGAQSVMAAYNSLDGEPCSSNHHLLTDILRNQWDFKGFVVSDYSSVPRVYYSHYTASSVAEAEGQCLQAGLDVDLPNGYDDLDSLYKAHRISIQDIDKAVTRVLTAKFTIGLYDHPYVDTAIANIAVRSPEHRKLALQAARETMTLLKNANHILPLNKDSIHTIGILGPAADTLSLGDYAGPYNGFKDEGSVNPLQGLQHILKNNDRVRLYQKGEDLNDFARACDVLVFFAGIGEGEGSDRAHLNLDAGQEAMIRQFASTGKKVIVVLQTGAPVDIRNWQDSAAAILEAWYPGERGGTAIAETLFGDNNPGGRLPVSWPKSVGQEPLYYAVKPSGRDYTYLDDDGKPMYPFGYGLSYTTFSYSNLVIPNNGKAGQSVNVQVTVTNSGRRAGDEVVQLYLHRDDCPLVQPLSELKAFKRVHLQPGESKIVSLALPARSFGYYDQSLHFTVSPGKFEVFISRDAEHDILKGELELQQ